MIFKRKYYSESSKKKKSKRDDKEMYESKNGRKSRHRFASISGGILGTGLGTTLVGKSIYDYSDASFMKDLNYESESLDNYNNYLKAKSEIFKKYGDINKVIDTNKKMSLSDKIESKLRLSKSHEQLQSKADALYKQAQNQLDEQRDNILKSLKKKRNKGIIKGSLLGAGVGVAAGIGLNELVKKRQNKLGIKRKSKTDYDN